MKPLRKAIFPVAGMGTRFLPATKTIPKEMLTIVDRPLIHYAVDEAIEAGCDTLIFVTGRSKRAVEDYFDSHPELEAELEAKGKIEALNIIRNIIPPHVKCIYVRQSQPLGLGHAVACAAHLIDNEPFAVLLPDDLIDGGHTGCLSQMLEIYKSKNGSILAVEQVPKEKVNRYGVIAPENGDDRPLKVIGIVEKPQPELAPSNWTVVGRYILTPDVMAKLVNVIAGAGGEIQLTDAIAATLSEVPTYGLPFSGKRFDCGNKHGFLEANIHYGLSQIGKYD
ncbi:MAG: UTP--glucose-1-phosphate uridylyltransferase GalU [Glaciimonas sp.]|nr:UTP--glucose-1-phosphate uridylyltransferase GalU [Glaciimonas sp.]